MRKTVVVSVVFCALFFTDRPSIYAREGVYMGADYIYGAMEGDFDGRDISFGKGDTLVVPDIDKGKGWGLHVGYHLPTNFSIELTMERTSHDGKRGGTAFDVRHTAMAGAIKYSFNAENRLQPYLQVALGVHVLQVEKGASNSGLVDDALYSGTGMALGTGLDLYLNRRLSLRVGAAYQMIDYNDAEGIVEEGALKDELRGEGLAINGGISYHF